MIFLSFNIHSLLYVFHIFFILCCKKFLLWYYLFGVLYLASWWASLSLDLDFFIIEICMYFLCFWHIFLFFRLYWLFLGLAFHVIPDSQDVLCHYFIYSFKFFFDWPIHFFYLVLKIWKVTKRWRRTERKYILLTWKFDKSH